MSETSEIPLFPLSTVLFPRGPLPLRIFEPRYVDMIKRCMREGSCFGVVLITEGGETGAKSGFVRSARQRVLSISIFYRTGYSASVVAASVASGCCVRGVRMMG